MDNTYVYDLDDIFCVWENEPDFAQNAMHFNLTFFEKNKNGTYNRHEETQVQYFYTIEDIHRCLTNIGFKNMKYYDFGTFLQGSNEGERIQVIAEKR